nr:beta-ketoacyl synthase N-terminal-like domain-containing protein [Pseudenhygromyxa sp. WMMC2535]
MATATELAKNGLPGIPGLEVTPLPLGHAAGLHAMALAITQLESGTCEWCIVGGVDSYLDADTLDWLAEHRQLQTFTTRSAFFPGEGAAFLVLTTLEVLRARKLSSRAHIVGVGTAQESALIKTEDICLGQGLQAAIAHACADPRYRGVPIDDVYCDINGERYRSEEWGFVALANAQPFVDPTAFHAPASSWGDVGAASGPLFAILAAHTWIPGHIISAPRGPSALIWASSEGGLRGAARLHKPF